MQRGSLRTSCGEPLCVLTLLFGKVFFRIHFALGLERLPVPIERESRLDPCLVGPPYGLELPLDDVPSIATQAGSPAAAIAPASAS